MENVLYHLVELDVNGLSNNGLDVVLAKGTRSTVDGIELTDLFLNLLSI